MASHWVGTWAATPAPADGVALSSPTIRMFPRISIGGDTICLRLSNAAGTGYLVIGATHVALRAPGPGIRPETDRVVTFNGRGAVKIPAGAFAISDPVAFVGGTVGRSCRQRPHPRRDSSQLRRDRPLRSPIQLSFTPGRFHRARGDVRQPRHRRLAFPVRGRRADQPRCRCDRRTWRIHHRWQHLDP